MSTKHFKFFEYSYFLFLIITTINLFLLTTVFKYSEYQFILNTIQYILQFVVVAKVCVEWRTKWSNEDILIGVLTAGIFLISACKFNNEDAFAYAFLILGAKGIDKKKILKVFFAITLVMYVATVGACLLGFIPNATTYRNVDSTHARMALGFIYTTALSAHFLTLIVCLVFIRERKISIVEIVLIGISSGVIYYLTEARIASFSIGLIFCGLIVAKICYVKNIEFKLVRTPLIKWGMIFASTIMMVISIIVGVFYKYDSAIWTKINDILSQRPLTNAITFNRYPLSLLGTHVRFHSSIYDGMNELPEYYYIINCSYIGVLFLTGVLSAIATLYVWTKLSHREANCNNYMNLFMMAVLAFFFFFEQRLFDFVYNPLFVLLFASYGEGVEIKREDIKNQKKYKNGSYVFRSILTGLAIAFAVESTVFNYKSISSFLYEGTTIDSAEVYNDGIFSNTDNDMFEYSTLEPMLILTNLKTYGDIESMFVEMAFRTKEDHYHYRQVDNVEYSVDYYSYNGNDEYEYIGTTDINSSKRATGFIEMPAIKGIEHNIILQFHFPDYYYVDIFALEFNGPKPFDISFCRIGIMCIVFTTLLYFVSKKEIDKAVNTDEEVVNESGN